MNSKIACFIFVALSSFVSTVKPLQLNKLVVHLDIVNPLVSKDDDLTLNVSIRSNWDKSIAIPYHYSWGLLNHGPKLAFLLLEIQKKQGANFKVVSLRGVIDNFSPEITDTLRRNDSARAEGFNFFGHFTSNKGEYRVRVLCRFSALNPDVADVYSNWIYFKCLKDIR